jgi:hypothetical protein
MDSNISKAAESKPGIEDAITIMPKKDVFDN